MPHLYPLLFEPNLHPVVWGGKRLCPYKELPQTDEPIGESWEVSVVPSGMSVVSNGVFAGKDLAGVISTSPAHVLGETVARKYGG